jgi:uncharacterized protein
VAPRLVKKAASFALPGESTRIAVVADTHSRPHPAIDDHLTSLRPDAILHAGDIGELSVLDDLARHAQLFAVRGNIDTRAKGLPDVLALDLVGAASALRILLVHIALYGPTLHANVARMARAEKANLIVCGHSHVPFIGQDRELTVFNPGSIGPRRFHLPIVFGTIDISAAGVRLAHIDCETGRPWSPPP